MIKNNLVINGETIPALFQISQARSEVLYKLLDDTFNATLEKFMDDDYFVKNIFIVNALQHAENELEEAFCLMNVSQDLAILEAKSKLI
jgi:hypothetical protein